MKTPERISTHLTASLAALLLCGIAGLPVASAGEAAATAPAADAVPMAEATDAASVMEAAVAASADPAPVSATDTAAAAAQEDAPAATDAAVATESAAPAGPRYHDRSYQDARIAQLRENARLRRENMERWRSARRWWNNPAAENRRQWNQSRSRWYRDMGEARRQAWEQYRPERSYSYHYHRSYP